MICKCLREIRFASILRIDFTPTTWAPVHNSCMDIAQKRLGADDCRLRSIVDWPGRLSGLCGFIGNVTDLMSEKLTPVVVIIKFMPQSQSQMQNNGLIH